MNVNEIWNLKYEDPILGLELGDINNNGQTELIAYTRTGVILIISLFGKIMHKQLISKDSPIWHLKVYDIDGDGNNELILGGLDGLLKTYKCNLTYNLEFLWSHKFGSSISGILIDDINNDNLDEIIVLSLDKTIRILNSSNGDLIWGQIFEGGVGEATIYPSSENTKELGVCSNDGTIRIFDGVTGDLLWFKKYADKIRCINYMNSIKGTLVLCGGDDKNLHFIDKNTQEEIKVVQFNDYIWKCVSFPFQVLNEVIVSSYSFAFFDNSIPLKNIDFTSEMICLNKNLDVKWKIKRCNIETLKIADIDNNLLFFAGTTNGEIMLIEEKIGRILWKQNVSSCTNMIEFFLGKRLLFSCHDNGAIYAFKL